MKLSTIRTAVRERLDDPTFETVKIDRWANYVLNDIYTRYDFPFVETSTTFTTTSGTDTYALSSISTDIDKIRLLTDNTNDVVLEYIEPIDLEETDPENETQSKPNRWTIYGTSLKLYPIPNGAYTIEAHYDKVQGELTQSTSEPNIPDRYMEAVVLGVYQKALEWNGDFDWASVIERQYESKIAKMIADYSKTSGQEKTIKWNRPEI